MYFNEKLVCLRDIELHWPISGFPMTFLFKLANQLRQNEGVSTGLFNIFRFVRVCIHKDTVSVSAMFFHVKTSNLMLCVELTKALQISKL